MDYVAESFPAQILSGFLSGSVNLYSWQEAVVDGVAGLYSGMASPRVGVNNAREIGNASITSYPFYARLDYEGAVSGKPFYSFRGPAAAAASVDHTTVSSGVSFFSVFSGTQYTLGSIIIPSKGYWRIDSQVSYGTISVQVGDISANAAGAWYDLTLTGGGGGSGIVGLTQSRFCPTVVPAGIYTSGVVVFGTAGGYMTCYASCASGSRFDLKAQLDFTVGDFFTVQIRSAALTGGLLTAFRVAD